MEIHYTGDSRLWPEGTYYVGDPKLFHPDSTRRYYIIQRDQLPRMLWLDSLTMEIRQSPIFTYDYIRLS